MFFLFSILFFFSFVFCFYMGVVLLDSGSVCLEFILPFGVFFELPFSFLFDFVSCFFFSAVSLISSVIFVFSSFYMSSSLKDVGITNKRFFFLLFLFVVSMFFLVFSGSWVLVMLGWDGLGLVSFLLVIFYNNSSSLDSGLITVFSNRLGDCFFILSFMFIFYMGWSYVDYLSFSFFPFFCFMLGLGLVTKSAQFPFSSWLPAAMAAPTPVSSLVHSSTLVTAGVYLLIRFGYLFYSVTFFFSIISLFTMLLAGLSASFELDFKKVVAMSTLSQLGFMIFSITMGYWCLSFLHMMFHAFFKSSLFLSTGSLMHYLLGGQDSRFFGSLGSSFVSKVFFCLSGLCLMGFPFSLGFYSKDSIIGVMMFNELDIYFLLFFLGCVFTVSYSIRLLKMGFFGFPMFFPLVSFSDSKLFYYPMFFLFIFCVFIGNFFFFNFIPVYYFSFFESFMGVFIIFMGYLFSKILFLNLLLNYFFMSLGFLSNLSTSYMSLMISKLSFFSEYSWLEIFGGKGFLEGSLKMKDNFSYFYNSKFLLILLFFFVLLLLQYNL